MNCRDIEPLIYLFRDGELNEEEQNRVSEHISGCAECRALMLSVKVMTAVVSNADYDTDIPVRDELFTGHLLHAIHKPVPSTRFILLKAAAACLLFILISTFIFQEWSFYQNRIELQASLQQANPGLSDCLMELKRKIHYHSLAAFARSDSLPVNLISEEALTNYVRENCGYNTSDIKTLKKLLIQAGLSD